MNIYRVFPIQEGTRIPAANLVPAFSRADAMERFNRRHPVSAKLDAENVTLEIEERQIRCLVDDWQIIDPSYPMARPAMN